MDMFATWIDEQLNERGWSVAELARRGGSSPGTIHNILKGNRGIGLDVYGAIARGLNVPIEIVLRKAQVLPSKNEDTEALLAYYQALNSNEQKEVLAYIQWRYEKRRTGD